MRTSFSVSRAEAIRRAGQQLESGDFLAELGRRIAYPTESQNPCRSEVLHAYLDAVLDGETGYVVPGRSVTGLAERITGRPAADASR